MTMLHGIKVILDQLLKWTFFRYQFLGFEPRNEKEQEQFKALEAFQQEHNGK